MKKSLLLAACFLVLTFGSFAQTITIDGVFFDWNENTQLDAVPNAETTFGEGDETSPPREISDPNYFADMDLEDVYGTSDENFIYLRIKLNSAANVLNIPNDTSYHGGGAIAAYISIDPGAGDTTGLTWGWWGNGYDYFASVYPADSVFEANTEYQQPLMEHKQSGNGWDYEAKDTIIGVSVAWNASNNEVEMAIPKSLLLNPKYLSSDLIKDSVAVMIFSGENFAPWRADYASMPGVAGFYLGLGNTTDVTGETGALPVTYNLSQNYPNPFNPATVINYSIAEAGFVKIKVYNLIGQEISTLINTFQSAGNYNVNFDAANLSTGVYYYSIESNNYKQTRKMIVLK